MKEHRQRFADFTAGGILALTFFTAFTLLSGVMLRLPGSGYGKGLAVMSAKISSLGLYQGKKPADGSADEPRKEPASVSPRIAGELIRLSGFGGWDLEAAPKETEKEKDSPENEDVGELLYPADKDETG